ncbi:MAG: tetratricopeptide repeat protein [Bacteroidota bacterium]
MKTRILFILIILLSSQILSSAPDSTSRKKYSVKARIFRIFYGEKWVERHNIFGEFNKYIRNQDYQNAIDFLTDELSNLDTLKNDYKMHTAGYTYGLRGAAKYLLLHYDAAMSDVNRSIVIVPKWSYGYFIRGNIHYQARDLQAAIDDYTKAIDRKRKRKEYIHYYYVRGDTYWNNGEIENAMSDFTKCIKLDRKWATPYLRRGSARRSLDDLKGAKADYEKALALNPHLIGGYQVLSYYYFEQKDYDASIGVIMDGLHHNPDNPHLYEYAGSFYLEKGENTHAITYYSKCLEVCRDSTDDLTRLQALIGISVAYYDEDDKENSRKYFDQAMHLQPLLNNGKEGLEELMGYCMGWMDKEKEVLPRMVEEFNLSMPEGDE